MKGESLISARCSDIMGLDCLYIAQGRNAEEAARLLVRHVRNDHSDFFGDMSANEMAGMERRIEGMMA